jgi:cell division ATPase FtsA
VIDIGADITNLTIFFRDAIRHTACSDGGNHFTNDIAVGAHRFEAGVSSRAKVARWRG